MPEPLLLGMALATAAGAFIPLGAFLARIEHIRPAWLEEELRHGVIAFGGGALLSAVALVLVPEATSRLAALPSLALFALGGATFCLLDRWLAQRSGQVSQFVAMMADYLPEAAALGALLTADPRMAWLMAGIIALQNLPEGFNAWREMRASRPEPPPLGLFLGVVALGPLAAAAGMLLLPGDSQALGAVMIFAAGGILYLVFGDIAPQARLEQHWLPPLGAVGGFLLGLAGHLAAA